MEQSSPDTIIIGSGVAGLSAALHLAERGLKPLLLEADDRFVGGRLAGGDEIEVKGYKFRLEHGVHGIWGQYRNIQAMLARHNLRPVFVPAQEETWVYNYHGFIRSAPVGLAIRKSWFPPPLHYLQLVLNPLFLYMLDIRDWLNLLNVWGGLIMGVGIDPFGETQPMRGMTLGDSTRRWSPALRAFFLGLARNGLSSHPDEVPLSGFLAFLRFYTLLRRDAWNFSYLPEDGGTSVCEPLAGRIRQLNGEIRLGAVVRQVAREGEGWRVAWESAGEVESAAAAQVILATDSNNAKKILKNSFGDEVDTLFFPRALENGIVRIWFDTKPRRGTEAGIFTGDFSLHNFFWLDRLYAPYRKWARETGGACLEAHIYGPPELLAKPDAILIAQAQKEIQQVWPELRGHRIGQHFQRNPQSHTLPAVELPVLHLGTVTKWPGLFCAGDWVRHTSPAFFLERACVTGIYAANEVLKARGLEEWKLVEYLPPEPFVGWIEGLMRRGRAKARARRRK